VPEAVLFDWGDTLIRFVYDEALVEAGHRAGLAALKRTDLPEVERLAAHFRERYEPFFGLRARSRSSSTRNLSVSSSAISASRSRTRS